MRHLSHHRPALIGFLIYVVPVFVAACGPSSDTVQAAIDEANYCETEADCTDIGAICPFGCNILVNESEAEEIEGLIKKFLDNQKSFCNYTCPAMGDVVCEGGSCVMSTVLDE
jgi:hypothetical protein